MSATSFNAQSENLWLAWQDLQAQTDEALKKGVTHYFKCIRQTSCDMLALEALTSARLGQNDERVFNHLVSLMETYREVIGLFDDSIKDTSPSLVEGLCEILSSRLRQFEDDLSGQGNPVAREKYNILITAITNMAGYIESQEKSYMADLPQVESLSEALLAGNPAVTWEALHNSIAEKTLPGLQAHYAQALQACQTSIDDLHTRKTAAYYTDLLEREWEVLGLIIQVQVKAIEAAFESTENNETDIYPILSKLREAYQQTGPIVGGLRRMMQPANAKRIAPDLTHEDFAQALSAGVATPPPVTIDGQAFITALLPKADELFESIRVSHLEYISNLQEEATGEISLANEVVAVFEKVRAGLALLKDEADTVHSAVCAMESNKALTINESSQETNVEESLKIAELPSPSLCEEQSDEANQETKIHDNVIIVGGPHATDVAHMAENPHSAETLHVDEPRQAIEAPPIEDSVNTAKTSPPNNNIDNEILSGITETLEIKIESLTESLQQFTENSTKQLATMPTGLPVLTEENLTTAASQLQAAWYSTPPTQETIADFLLNAASLEAFATYNEQFAKHITNASTRIEKASFRFKKETLLYEISTYEEILYHSVSRLRESTQPHISAAVTLLDETFIQLKALLTTNGITIIRPAAHEPFNGREHEVLIAEETEGFAKGEIVKVMTSGYKYKDQVILRANVIAAR